MLSVKGREGSATSIDRPAPGPIVRLLRCALCHLRWIGEGQHKGPTTPAPLILNTLSNAEYPSTDHVVVPCSSPVVSEQTTKQHWSDSSSCQMRQGTL